MKCQTALELVIALLLGSILVLACADDDDDNTDGTDTTSDGDTDTDSDTDTETDTDSDTDTSSPDAGNDAGGLGGFGDPCVDNINCESGVCHEFGQLGLVCTLTCENNDQCPEGSQGKKCNEQSVCRP